MGSPEPATRPALEAVLLAAGAGRRLGVPKALLELHGRWMLPSLVRSLLEGGAASVCVVIREEERQALLARGLDGRARWIVNPAAAQGRATSLQCGLLAVSPEAAVLVHPCDVPLLSPAAVALLVSQWHRHPSRDALAARLVTPGGRGGHPLLLGRERASEARGLGAHSSLRGLLHRDPAARLDVALHGDPGPFLDVDTPEQHALLESLITADSQSGTDQR